ncbi:hypothetical protein D3C83_128460 [compost metagenome]
MTELLPDLTAEFGSDKAAKFVAKARVKSPSLGRISDSMHWLERRGQMGIAVMAVILVLAGLWAMLLG